MRHDARCYASQLDRRRRERVQPGTSANGSKPRSRGARWNSAWVSRVSKRYGSVSYVQLDTANSIGTAIVGTDVRAETPACPPLAEIPA